MRLVANCSNFNKIHTGYDKREHERSIIIDNPIQRHLTKSGDFDRDIPKEGTATKSLLDDPPPSYEKCVV